MSADRLNCLHIYAQEYGHDQAYVVGEREALIALRDAIDRVLANEEDNKETFEAYAGDGEGFDVIVRCVDNTVFEELMLPYTDEVFDRKGRHPANIGCVLLEELTPEEQWGPLCHHANKHPKKCPCEAGCYCKKHICKGQK